MVNKTFSHIAQVVPGIAKALLNTGKFVKPKRWQGIEAPAEMFEATFINFSVPMVYGQELVDGIKPNLPWADIHFQERIGGEPLNPGESYKQWPFYGRDKEMRKGEKFSHTYMERFWPKHANGGRGSVEHVGGVKRYANWGIRYAYGDLLDVVELLAKDPTTRQAFLPVWFPEDTGAVHGERVPCTLGYMFIIREGYLHITYYIRSCDFLRHFQDDVYLAILLANKVRAGVDNNLKLGMFRMDITSLHIFAQEYSLLENKYGEKTHKP